MLKYTRNSLLNLKDITTLNAWVTTYLPNFSFNSTIIVVQKIE